MDIEEVIAREAMRDTIARYNHAGDGGRVGELVTCFAPEGVLEIEGEAPHEGRSAIEERLRQVPRPSASDDARRTLRHHVSSVRVERRGPNEGRGFSYFLVVTDAGLDHWGTYRDRFEPFGDAWLFAYRRVRVEGAAPDSRFAAEIERLRRGAS